MDSTKLSVTEMLAAFASGTLTSEAAVAASKAAFEADRSSAEPLNGFVEFFDDALDMARAADAERAAGSRKRLLGVPFAVKDNISIKGRKLTCASNILEGYVAPYSATVIERLVAEGAIPVGRTNMDEFAMGSSCEYSRYGASRNPVDRSRTPGGSSGGSAAVVAGFQVPFSLGTDTGGSVRLPGSFTGIYGFKPSYGAVSRYGVVAFGSSLDQVGVFARTGEDVALVTSVAAGKDPHDETSEAYGLESLASISEARLAGLRIAIPTEFVGQGLSPEVRAVFERSVALFRDNGAIVEEVSLPILESSIAIYYIIAPAEASSNLSRFDGIRFGARIDGGKGLLSLYNATRSKGFGAEVRRRILIGNYVLSSGYADAYYKKALKVRALLRKELSALFGKYDLLLSPTCPEPAFRIGEKANDPMSMYLTDLCTTFANLSGVPALSVPAGKTPAGLPVGIQLAAARGGEATIFGAARAFAKEASK